MKHALRQLFRFTTLMAMVCLVAACGGGGSSSPSTTVSGVASKGPIRGGTVEVFAVKADGSRGDLLGTATTNTDTGRYEISGLQYNGNIIVIVSGGDYVDEATGDTKANTVLKAALPSATGSVSVAVTPLTDVAFKQMSSSTGGFTTANITTSNAVVSTAFGVDIIGTQPADVTDTSSVAGANQAAIDYGVALAAISQMVNNGDATDVKDVIEQIQSDLSAETPLLTSTGPALTQAITDVTATSPVMVDSITTDSISGTIDFFTTNEVNPPEDIAGVAQAKGLISDLRNTVLTVVDYNTGEVSSALKTPFDATVAEIETQIEPELSGVGDRVAWVVSAAGSIVDLQPSTSYTFTDDLNHAGETLTITTAATGNTATITVTSTTATLLSGTISVDDLTAPTSGSLSITELKTASGNGTVTASYSSVTSGSSTVVTLKGNITTPAVTFDFDDDTNNQKFTVTLTEVPGDPTSVMLTKAYFKGVAASQTVRITGVIDIPTLVWNPYLSPANDNAAIPTEATLSGKIEAFSGASTVLTLEGALVGSFSNAATYNPVAPDSASNFPNWSGTFNGLIKSASGIDITVFLKASMPSYQTVNFETKYTRVVPSGTIFLTCTGTYNDATEITTLSMTNQNGLQVALSHDNTLPVESKITGTIKTSGGEGVATFSNMGGALTVTYADSYFETIL